jgi:hypothetical protein
MRENGSVSAEGGEACPAMLKEYSNEGNRIGNKKTCFVCNRYGIYV